MCGGTAVLDGGASGGSGLSPRVRGNLSRISRTAAFVGSIPACAGEPRTDRPGPLRLAGLSPRVRGNPPTPTPGQQLARSIPACAGEPGSSAYKPGAGRVYPRVCGGTRRLGTSLRLGWGLSPRVRGNQGGAREIARRPRSIPACAGEPNGLAHGADGVRVYPRVCGGTRPSDRCYKTRAGLSPRVRGNLWQIRRHAEHDRSIPACAGEPMMPYSSSSSARVYPRVCGGTRSSTAAWYALTGLSPRVRGNRGASGAAEPHSRSIPACAGEPRGRRRWRPGPRVYPRVCGGTRRRSEPRPLSEGLSPRVRGNRCGCPGPAPRTRSIPACAGEPVQDGLHRRRHQVYPRVCGGTADRQPFLLRAGGLSPRVRGNHLEHAYAGGEHGSIPACAGEPPCGMRPARGFRVYPRVCGGTW